jgi:Protein of unknown function (DUF2721)
VNDITHTIQLAVAPVFLLTSLGTLLSVLCQRLGRIVDRARVLAERLLPSAAGTSVAPLRAELAVLAKRRKLVNRAITACTIAAVLICLVITVAFLGFILRTDFGRVVSALFIAAITAFTVGLLHFLREILTAVEHSSIADPLAAQK